MSLSKLTEMQTCFIVKLSEIDLAAVRDEPYTLACGDVLNVGDTFTEIGSSGSAGNQPVRVTAPWVQRYRGLLRAKQSHFIGLASCWNERDLVLFDAFNSEDPNEGFVSPAYRAKWEGTKDISDGYFMAYLRHGNDNQLFHTRGGSSSSVCKCSSLTRWYAPDEQDIDAQAQGACITRPIWTDETERKICYAIAVLQQQKKRVSIAAVSREVGISRECINRRYQYFFAA